jgi:hypothetical protein
MGEAPSADDDAIIVGPQQTRIDAPVTDIGRYLPGEIR